MLRDLKLDIPAGQRLLVAGPSGAGKSTLLRALAGLLLAGQGQLSGSVRIGGRERVRGTSSGQQPAPTGLLLQDPTAAVVADTVGRDVAFGLENLRVPRIEIWPRVEAALVAVRFPYDVRHLTTALSGGETQRLALAGTLVLGAPVLLLDEPTSMLDTESAASLRAVLKHAIASRGCTTVIVEHELEPWIDFVDRLVVLDASGQVVADGPPQGVLAAHGNTLADNGVWVPGLDAPDLIDVDSGLVSPWQPGPVELVNADGVGVTLKSPIGSDRGSGTVALDGVSTQLRSGRAVAVTGPTGAGKSTLTSVLAGLLRPTSGRVYADPALATGRGDEPWRWRSVDLATRLAWAPQFPEHGVVTSTVLDEVLASARACRRDPSRARARANGLLEALSLSSLAAASPYHLSGGEQRRLMVASALAHGPYAVLLDEPTVGQDRHTWAAVLGAVRSARDAGAGVVVSTHDSTAVAALADSVVKLVAGRLVAA